MNTEISYGKARVPFYRVYARPLVGVRPIPESSFTGRDNTLFALRVDVEVFGRNVLPAYTDGDNSAVVATDSMKNVVLRRALAYDGATLEGYLYDLGRVLLTTYPQMEALRVTGDEQPFVPARVPAGGEDEGGGGSVVDSPVLFNRSQGDHSMGALSLALREDDIIVTDHRCGHVDLQLIKVTGSAFTRFVRDDYTTLPERGDRPLYIYLDVHWTYGDVDDLLSGDPARYIPAEQVRDLAATVFHSFVSESIQHLVYEMGKRLLARFPGMATVSFTAQNRTWDPVALSEDDARIKVYSDPFPAYGTINLTLSRES